MPWRVGVGACLEWALISAAAGQFACPLSYGHMTNQKLRTRSSDQTGVRLSDQSEAEISL